MALGTLRAAPAAGMRVPEELGIASAVDSEALENATPPLTVFDLHPQRLAREAVLLLTVVRLQNAETPVAAGLSSSRGDRI